MHIVMATLQKTKQDIKIQNALKVGQVEDMIKKDKQNLERIQNLMDSHEFSQVIFQEELAVQHVLDLELKMEALLLNKKSVG